MSHVTCSIDGCTTKHLARGWCAKHYSRWNRHGDPLWEPEPLPDFRPCAIDGCGGELKAKGLCSHHLERKRRFGSPTAIPPKMKKGMDTRAAGEQECTKCSRLLPLSEFSTDSRSTRGCKSYCKACGYEMAKSWAARNREHMAAQQRERHSRLTPDERAKKNAVTKLWKEANRARVRDSNHRRKALLRASEVGEIDYALLWEQCGGACMICEKPLDLSTPWPSPDFASVDHIHPLSKGGPHTQSNLQYACLQCNLRKNDKVETSTAIDSPVKR